MKSNNFVGPIKATKSQRGYGKRRNNYGARPKAGKPSKAAMYLKSLRMHDKMNFSAQFTSHMGIIGRMACHELMALEVCKVAAWKATTRTTNYLTMGEQKAARKERKAAAYRASQA